MNRSKYIRLLFPAIIVFILLLAACKSAKQGYEKLQGRWKLITMKGDPALRDCKHIEFHPRGILLMIGDNDTTKGYYQIGVDPYGHIIELNRTGNWYRFEYLFGYWQRFTPITLDANVLTNDYNARAFGQKLTEEGAKGFFGRGKHLVRFEKD